MSLPEHHGPNNPLNPTDQHPLTRIDVEADQRNRDSDFAFELPLGEVNESTFMIAPEVQSSPDRTAAPEDDNEPTSPQKNDFAPLFDQQSDDGYDMDQDQRDFGDVPVPLDEDDEPDVTTHNTTAWTEEPSHVTTAMRISARDVMKRTIRISKHGIEYPSLPPTLVKRLAQNFAKANGANGKIAPDALKAIIQASDWFFEQLGDDLAAYSSHAGRKTIDESDILTLMKRYVEKETRLPLILGYLLVVFLWFGLVRYTHADTNLPCLI
jgi:histone H3/H4